MRIRNNPNKDEIIPKSDYLHQVIIPVYIPNLEGYFKDSFKILKLCIESLGATIHDKTFVTIVNNGSGDFIKEYLDQLFVDGKIQEIIHTQNIGKLNAVLKGLVGNNIDLVTISDSDVLFLSNWQIETIKVFRAIPKVGVVGIVPQFNMFKNKCGNVLFDNLVTKKLKFIPIKSAQGLIRFYDSIGWDRSYNKDYLKYGLGLEFEKSTVFIGSGHFVATYKKQIFQDMKSYLNYKLGGDSENYLDILPLKYDYWRVTTQDNYAYHMGNVFEDWMSEIKQDVKTRKEIDFRFVKQKAVNNFKFYLKNRLFVKFLGNEFLSRIFYRWKKLPKPMIRNYNNIVPK